MLERSFFCSAVLGLSVSGALAQTGGAGRPQFPSVSPSTTPARQTAPTVRPDPSAGPVDLRPKFTAGRVTRYTLNLSSDNSTAPTDPGAAAARAVVEQAFSLKLAVLRTGDSGTDLEMSFEHARIHIKTDDLDLSGDSGGPTPSTGAGGAAGGSGGGAGGGAKPAKLAPAAPANRPATPSTTDALDQLSKDLLGEVARTFTQTTLKLHVDPSGRISSVSGGEALGALTGQGLIAGTSLAGGDAMTNWIVSSCEPKPSLRVGESWSCHDRLGATPVGGFEMNTTHTLTGATADRADISVRGQTVPASGSPAHGAMPPFESTYTGSYHWDLKVGELESLSTQMTMTVQGQKAGPGGTTSKTDIKIDRVR